MDFRLGVTILIIFSAFVDAKPSQAMEGFPELEFIDEKREMSPSSSSSSSTKWILIQRKTSGKDGGLFNENGWEGYKSGFGNSKAGDYWLGLDHLHRLTSSEGSHWRIMIKYRFAEGGIAVVKNDGFQVANELEEYQLHVGNLYEAYGKLSKLTYHRFDTLNGAPFTTKDRDNDVYGDNCAVYWKGGFWFKPKDSGPGDVCVPFYAPTTWYPMQVGVNAMLMAIRRID